MRALACAGAAACLLAVAPGCIQNDGSRNPFKKFTTVSVDDERATGSQADAQIQQQVVMIDDPVVLGFINDLGQEIVRRIEPQPFIYRFRVIVDPSLNAFALPGGYIYFHSGTILAAGSIEELAGVMAHEIAHVKGRHYARLVEKAMVPDLLSKLAGIAATVASGEAAPMMVSEGLNVALQLRFTREFEAEADELGAAFMARSGYEPTGMGLFFDRLLATRDSGMQIAIPPYLYSHPDVETRLDRALERAETLTVTGEHDPGVARAFHRAQIRLALMLRDGRTTLPSMAAPPDRDTTQRALDAANALASDALVEEGVAELDAGIAIEPNDPRLYYRRGELYQQLGLRRKAIASYRAALALDPSVALN